MFAGGSSLSSVILSQNDQSQEPGLLIEIIYHPLYQMGIGAKCRIIFSLVVPTEGFRGVNIVMGNVGLISHHINLTSISKD